MGKIAVFGSIGYIVDELVGVTPNFKTYRCHGDGADHESLMKIAVTKAQNGLLDREAFLLGEISSEIANTEAIRELGYNNCFPTLEESFVEATQGDRRINITAFSGVDRVANLVPLKRIRSKEKRRIDPKTSAWIFGRLLKIFMFTHEFGVSVGRLAGENILINPGKHHVTFFDWTNAQHHNARVPVEIARDEISCAAREVILALGGDPFSCKLPESDQLTGPSYADMLFEFANKEVSCARQAHEKFYGLVRDLWPREFHAFTTIPTNN